MSGRLDFQPPSLKKDIILSSTEKKIIANPHKQDLAEHSFTIGVLAKLIFESLGLQTQNNEAVARHCFKSGFFHDIGKIDASFQEWSYKPTSKTGTEGTFHNETNKKKFNDIPRHNELSFAIGLSLLNKNSEASVLHAIYWHHAKKERGADEYTVADIFGHSEEEETLLPKVNSFLSELNSIYFSYFESNLDLELIDSLDTHSIATPPKFKKVNKRYGSLEYDRSNYLNLIIRACLIQADRIVSALSKETLASLVKKRQIHTLLPETLKVSDNYVLLSDIKDMSASFASDPERNKNQSYAVRKLVGITKDSVAVAQGPAGVGKTKLALEFSEQVNSKQIFWICPRLSVCENIYNELTGNYLKHSSIELLTGSERRIFKEGQETISSEIRNGFDCDVVITTIDQVVNSLNSHTQALDLFRFIDATLIFDEYHEIATIENMIHSFRDLLTIKSLKSDSVNTLLLSATPDPAFTGDFLDLNISNIVRMKSYHSKPIKISLKCYDPIGDHPLVNSSNKNTFYISNTISVAQSGYLNNQNENSVIYHSMYNKQDKTNALAQMMERFGKNKGSGSLELVRSAQNIKASLNISAAFIHHELCSPESTLQIEGRLNRFAEYNKGELTLHYPMDRKINRYYLSKIEKSYHRTWAWLDYLKAEKGNEFEITKDQLYDLYFQFYETHSEVSKKDWEANEQSALKSLVKNNFFEPVQYWTSARKKEGKLAQKSLRGSSMYINALRVKLNDGEAHAEGYLYDVNNPDLDQCVTLSSTDFRVIDEFGPLATFQRVARKMNKAAYNKYNSKDYQMINRARDPMFPIYTSYDAEDRKHHSDCDSEKNLVYVTKHINKKTGKVTALGLIPRSLLKKYKITGDF